MQNKNNNTDFGRHLLPWFRADSHIKTAFPLVYILDCIHLSHENAAILCDTSPATLKRWIKGTPPVWCIPYLLACQGFILVSEWQGWRIINGKLHEPQNRSHSLLSGGLSQGDFKSLNFQRMNYATVQNKIDDLSIENSRLLKIQIRADRRASPKPKSNIIDFYAHKKART
ncbi:MAG: hypothetical protein QM500_04190 [Methylococcales bacterium]